MNQISKESTGKLLERCFMTENFIPTIFLALATSKKERIKSSICWQQKFFPYAAFPAISWAEFKPSDNKKNHHLIK